MIKKYDSAISVYESMDNFLKRGGFMKLIISLFALFSILFICSCSTNQPSIERAFVFKDGKLFFHKQEVLTYELPKGGEIVTRPVSGIKEFKASNLSIYICDKADNSSEEIFYSSITHITYHKKALKIDVNY